MGEAQGQVQGPLADALTQAPQRRQQRKEVHLLDSQLSSSRVLPVVTPLFFFFGVESNMLCALGRCTLTIFPFQLETGCSAQNLNRLDVGL